MTTPIESIPLRQLRPGIAGHYAHGQSMSLGLVKIAPNSILEMHAHPHEQITYILEGELEMIVGGETCLLKAGMVQIIPSNVPHAATSSIGCTLIDVFSPVREDYI